MRTSGALTAGQGCIAAQPRLLSQVCTGHAGTSFHLCEPLPWSAAGWEGPVQHTAVY